MEYPKIKPYRNADYKMKIYSSGYLKIRIPNHPSANCGYVTNSKLVVEKVIRKHLPHKSVVHHINNDRIDDKHLNLVACDSVEYHNLIHRREEAYKICGKANWRKCRYCGEYDDPKYMYQEPPKNGRTDSCRHRKCFNKYMREYNARIKKLSKAKSDQSQGQGIHRVSQEGVW